MKLEGFLNRARPTSAGLSDYGFLSLSFWRSLFAESIARISYQAADTPTLQLGRATYCFPFCIAEVDEGFLA
jgi:hypothetical protein